MINLCYYTNIDFKKFATLAVLFFCTTVSAITSTITPDKKENEFRLQIVSEVYKKQPYIQVPTAWIDPKLKNQIIKLMQKSTKKNWVLREIKLQDPWTNSLKCHAAVNIGVWQLKKKIYQKKV